MKTSKKLFLLVFIFSTFNCASVKAPKNWLSEPEKISEDVYGAWITLRLEDTPEGEYQFIGGEFLGYEESNVYILKLDGLSIIKVNDIKKAIIDLYQRETNTLTGWWVGMTLSTASHGWLLALTAPIWVISGIINSAIASHSGRYAQDFPDSGWFEKMNNFSRFPGGLPKEVDLNTLKPKPYSNE